MTGTGRLATTRCHTPGPAAMGQRRHVKGQKGLPLARYVAVLYVWGTSALPPRGSYEEQPPSDTRRYLPWPSHSVTCVSATSAGTRGRRRRNPRCWNRTCAGRGEDTMRCG